MISKSRPIATCWRTHECRELGVCQFFGGGVQIPDLFSSQLRSMGCHVSTASRDSMARPRRSQPEARIRRGLEIEAFAKIRIQLWRDVARLLALFDFFLKCC